MKPSRAVSEILVALDGSDLSRRALEAAILVARAFKARVQVVHVVPRLEEYARHRNLMEPLLKELTAVGREIVEDGARRLSEAGIPYATSLSSGSPANELTEYARARGIDLVVMGSRGLTPTGPHPLGSVSYQTSMAAPCPVLVVHDPDPFPRILLAIDGSRDSLHAAEFVEEIAARLGSKVSLMFVVPARPEGAFTIAQTPADPFLLDIENRMVRRGIVVVRHVKYGHPVEEILKASERHTLVVLGARGRSDLALDYVGGVGDKVLRNAKTSTLIVR